MTSTASARSAAELEQQASDPSLWDDPARGQQITSKLARLKAEVDRYDALIARVDDAARHGRAPRRGGRRRARARSSPRR